MINLIAAVSDNGVIGKNNQLPWHLPADLQYFKKITLGHPIIMGRKNYESIGRALSGRKNIILTRNKDFSAENIFVANSLKEAFEIAKPDDCFVIGGAEIYREALPFCDKLYITKVHATIEGDTFMPEFPEHFKEISCIKNYKDEKNGWDYDFLVFTNSNIV